MDYRGLWRVGLPLGAGLAVEVRRGVPLAGLGEDTGEVVPDGGAVLAVAAIPRLLLNERVEQGQGAAVVRFGVVGAAEHLLDVAEVEVGPSRLPAHGGVAGVLVEEAL